MQAEASITTVKRNTERLKWPREDLDLCHLQTRNTVSWFCGVTELTAVPALPGWEWAVKD